MLRGFEHEEESYTPIHGFNTHPDRQPKVLARNPPKYTPHPSSGQFLDESVDSSVELTEMPDSKEEREALISSSIPDSMCGSSSARKRARVALSLKAFRNSAAAIRRTAARAGNRVRFVRVSCCILRLDSVCWGSSAHNIARVALLLDAFKKSTNAVSKKATKDGNWQ